MHAARRRPVFAERDAVGLPLTLGALGPVAKIAPRPSCEWSVCFAADGRTSFQRSEGVGEGSSG